MKLKKFTGLLLCAALALSMAACKFTTPAVVMTVEGEDIPAGLYLMYQYQAYSSAKSKLEDKSAKKPQTPEMLLEEKQFQEQVYAAVMKLPEKQAKRIYARYYLRMTVNKIAEVEGVDPSRVRDSIRRGLKQLAKYF